MESEGWMRALHKIAAILTGGAVVGLLAGPTGAAVRHGRHGHASARHAKTEVEPYKGALVEDADSGKVLYESNADMSWPPASMAKMMLLLVAEDQLTAGNVRPNDPVRVSERAAHTGGSLSLIHI